MVVPCTSDLKRSRSSREARIYALSESSTLDENDEHREEPVTRSVNSAR